MGSDTEAEVGVLFHKGWEAEPIHNKIQLRKLGKNYMLPRQV